MGTKKHRKANIGNVVRLGQILEFEVAFPNEKKLSVEEYLKGGSRDIILNAAAFFLGFKNNNSIYADNRKFLEMFFRKENHDFANHIYEKIKIIEENGKAQIITPYSSLKLFELFFSKAEEPETQNQAEFEVNLFKAYLTLNSEFTRKQEVGFTTAKECEDQLQAPMSSFCTQYPIFDKTTYKIEDIWITQTIKAIYLFTFLEAHSKTKNLLNAFLTHFNCTTWQEYVKNIMSLTMSVIQKQKESHTDIIVEPGHNFEQDCAFIEKLIVFEQDDLDQNDFITLRAKPLYKVNDGVYRIIFDLFVVEKTFKGVYFLLRDVNKTLPSATRIKEIKSFYGDEFSEKILCYKVIESIYPEKCIRFSGKDLADMNINAESDYYVRKGNNLLLFESKDFLIAADKKMSFDFNVYEDAFGKILDYEESTDGKIKAKAVLQLTNNIRRILKKEFPPDQDYHYRNVYIYPILVTHDHQYDTPGFNELIDFWLQDELQKLKAEGLYIQKVKPLTVVNIDSLIRFQIGLLVAPLHKLLMLYHEFKQNEDDLFSRFIPFSFFMERYLHQKGLWNPPPIIELLGPALFKEEFEERRKIESVGSF